MIATPIALEPRTGSQRTVLSDRIHEQLKQALFDFRLLPGERISETEIAMQTGASRTPVREALTRLMREGFVTLAGRSGWQVCDLDFALFDQLYEVRTIIELAAVERLCKLPLHPWLPDLQTTWQATESERPWEARTVFELDEAFHATLVQATGNPELVRMHRNAAERIRIIRQLDFTEHHRIDATYDEHVAILRAIGKHRESDARRLLTAHIETSRQEVRKISLQRLYQARNKALGDGDARLHPVIESSSA